jgi:sulfonate transport system substrate-binding protein
MLRRLFCIALVASAILFASPAGKPYAFAGDVLRIGWLKAPNDITLAKSHGSLEKALGEQGVSVSWVGPFAAAAPALEALNADTIDITAGSSTSSISGLAAKIPFVIFAYQKMSPGAEGILVKRGSPIKSIADLVGKTVAVNRGGTGEYLLMRALATHHIDPTSVTRVYMSPPDSGAAFSTGHVDAWATWDPFVSIARATYDAQVLADGTEIGSENAVVLIASRKLAEDRRAVLDCVYKTLEAENAWAIAHPAEAGRIWAEAMGLPATLAGPLGANNSVPTTPVKAADIAQISEIADWYVAEKIVPVKPVVSTGVIQLK